MKDLQNVYAIRFKDGRYVPRSSASPTYDMPKLWVSFRDVSRVSSHRYPGSTVVEFQLKEVSDAEPE